MCDSCCIRLWFSNWTGIEPVCVFLSAGLCLLFSNCKTGNRAEECRVLGNHRPVGRVCVRWFWLILFINFPLPVIVHFSHGCLSADARSASDLNTPQRRSVCSEQSSFTHLNVVPNPDDTEHDAEQNVHAAFMFLKETPTWRWEDLRVNYSTQDLYVLFTDGKKMRNEERKTS